MSRRIRLTEGDLHRIINESVRRVLMESHKGNILTEGKIETWSPDEFVSYEDITYFLNFGGEFREKNLQKAMKKNIPFDECCAFCSKPLNGKYKTLYHPDPFDEEARKMYSDDDGYYAHPHPHMEKCKVGLTCAKAVEKAHKEKYGR